MYKHNNKRINNWMKSQTQKLFLRPAMAVYRSTKYSKLQKITSRSASIQHDGERFNMFHTSTIPTQGPGKTTTIQNRIQIDTINFIYITISIETCWARSGRQWWGRASDAQTRGFWFFLCPLLINGIQEKVLSSGFRLNFNLHQAIPKRTSRLG